MVDGTWIFFLEEEQVERRHGYSLQIFKELQWNLGSGNKLGSASRKVDDGDRMPWEQEQLNGQNPNIHSELLSQPRIQQGESSCFWVPQSMLTPYQGFLKNQGVALPARRTAARAELCAHLFLSRQIYAAMAKGPRETIYC